MSDYDILPLPTGVGELYLGDNRSASWKWERPGNTIICLTEQTRSGETGRIGWTMQNEKAQDVCRLWVETGEISINFHEGMNLRGA